MQPTVITSIILLTITASSAAADRVASREEFRGRWSRDCGDGRACHVDIDDTKSRKTVAITFSIEGKGIACSWSVDAIFDKGFGGPAARDPNGNYYFYLTRQEDGRSIHPARRCRIAVPSRPISISPRTSKPWPTTVRSLITTDRQ